MTLMNRVAAILGACGSDEALMPATMLYNEGWMLRLVLDWFARQPESDHPLAFSEDARWYIRGAPSLTVPRAL